ncbi:unnamed protein product, partial [Allacma fusca]
PSRGDDYSAISWGYCHTTHSVTHLFVAINVWQISGGAQDHILQLDA